jgi:hypothetical protein
MHSRILIVVFLASSIDALAQDPCAYLKTDAQTPHEFLDLIPDDSEGTSLEHLYRPEALDIYRRYEINAESRFTLGHPKGRAPCDVSTSSWRFNPRSSMFPEHASNALAFRHGGRSFASSTNHKADDTASVAADSSCEFQRQLLSTLLVARSKDAELLVAYKAQIAELEAKLRIANAKAADYKRRLSSNGVKTTPRVAKSQ